MGLGTTQGGFETAIDSNGVAFIMSACSYVGAYTGDNLTSITALDPAGIVRVKTITYDPDTGKWTGETVWVVQPEQPA